jgi:uncharacterized RDD family membrane protein YckC
VTPESGPAGLPPALDKLTIETPEQMELEFPLAGVGSRFLALFVDSAIQGVTILASFVAFLMVGFTPVGFYRSASVWSLALLILVFFLVYNGYFAFFEALWSGQTPGKRYAGLRVIKENGAPISIFDAVTRNLIRPVDQIPGLYAVGIISVLVSSRNQRLGDFAAGTVVVHEKPLEGLTTVWRRAASREERGGEAAPRLGAERLTAEEFRLIETFLERRHSLEAPVRDRFAREIANRLGEKLEVPLDERRVAENFLESLARERRG